MNVKFLGIDCTVIKDKYSNNGRIALELVAAKDTQDMCKGEPMCMASINLPEVALAPDEVIIKDYSENEGILKLLLRAKVVKCTGRLAQTGFVTAPVCKCLI
jgi:hypothetical protein